MSSSYIFVSFLFAHAFALDCANNPILLDGTSVPIEPTRDGDFATPECESIGLTSIAPLKCVDGDWHAVDPIDPELTEKVDNFLPFCIDPADPKLIDQLQEQPSIHSLRVFWEHIKEDHELTEVGCPSEAFECVNFDEFDLLYAVGESETAIEQFVGIPLDEPCDLEYSIFVDAYVREFTFFNGLEGHVVESDNSATFAVLNSLEEAEFTLEIRPCEDEEDCRFVMFLLDQSEDVIVEDEAAEPSDEEESVFDSQIREMREEIEMLKQSQGMQALNFDSRLLDLERDHGVFDRRITGLEKRFRKQKRRNNDLIKERLEKLSPENRRRHLQGFDGITITIMYDPAVQSSNDAWNKAREIVLDFNSGLRKDHNHAQFYIMLYRVVAVPTNTFKNAPTSGCSSGPPNHIGSICEAQRDALPAHEKADIHHCFTKKGAFSGSVVGCASEGNRGVTEMGHGKSIDIAIHEIGHTMGAKHDDSSCRCTAHFLWCWHTECTIMHPKISGETGVSVARKFSRESIDKMNRNSHWNTRTWEVAAARTTTTTTTTQRPFFHPYYGGYYYPGASWTPTHYRGYGRGSGQGRRN